MNGCASKPAHVAVATPPPPVLGAMPQPPAGGYAGMTIPARLADGSYPTPNQHLGEAATLWHLRVALNVAALGCRGADGDAITAGYNAMLGKGKAVLTKANADTIKAEGGQASYDAAMTRLYNFFAQPAAKAGFCAAAAAVTTDAASVPAAGLATFATTALARLDAPFVQFYRDYDSYRVQLASWQNTRLRVAMQPVTEQRRVAMAVSAPTAIRGDAAASAAVPHLSVDPAIFRRP
ncbi:hypothetical protein EAH79_08560 [Sphingomonas koreensis]|nr:hypothetical protein EAH79_08560 [Sphingomonas koreensis]